MENKLLIIIFLFINSIVYASSEISKKEAKNLANQLNSHFGANTSENVFKPMNGQSELKTVDNKKSSKASIGCEDAKPFAKLILTGNSDMNLLVEFDNDSNPGFDLAYTFNGISGVHKRGIVVCNSNTFSNCNYYNWEFNPNNYSLSLNLTNRNNAPSTYCINSSCSYIGRDYTKKVLDDITGGVIAVLQSSNLVISRIEDTNSNINILFGQTQNCNNSTTSYKGTPRGTPSNIDATTEMNENNVGFDYMMKSEKNTQSNPTSANDYKGMTDVTIRSSRSAKVDNGNEVTYKVKKNGKIENDTFSMDYDSITKEEYCSVQWEEVNTMVNTSGQVKSNTNTVSKSKREEYRKCSNSICPFTPPERIKYNCGETNKSIGESAAALNMIEQMSKDISCSN